MRSLLLLGSCALLFGCAGEQSQALRRQWRNLTQQQRASFSEAGDSVMLAPTPDTGFAGQGDPTHDCASCIPR